MTIAVNENTNKPVALRVNNAGQLLVSGLGGSGGGGGDASAANQVTQTNLLTTINTSNANMRDAVGGVDAAVPASDTANGTLIGYLKRISARITAQIAAVVALGAQLPASLGAKGGTASLSIVPATDAGMATAAKQDAIVAAIQAIPGGGGGGGGLTDTQLRANPLSVVAGGSFPVTGPLTAVQLGTMTLGVAGPLTDAQLRANPVPVAGTFTVSGTLTNTELRAAPVGVTFGGYSKLLECVFSRTNDQVNYTAGDVIGPTGTNAQLVFPAASTGASKPVMITGCTVMRFGSGTTAPDLELWVYKAATPVVADNAPAQFNGDLVGVIKIPQANWVSINGIPRFVDIGDLQMTVQSTTNSSIAALLVVRNAYQAELSEQMVVRLRVLQDPN